ncbi:MAG: hypothetical protein ACI9XB_003567 [Gammaproteobacteria bacterium]
MHCAKTNSKVCDNEHVIEKSILQIVDNQFFKIKK